MKLLGRKIPNRGFLINADNEHIPPRNAAALLWQFYEKAEINFVRRFLRRDLDVIELGSSLGVVSLHIIKRQEPARKLICVEANPFLIPTIEANLTQNASWKSVVVLNRAIDYSRQEYTAFAIHEDNLVSAQTGLNAANTQMVKATTLGEIVREYQFADFALVADIEGAEIGLVLTDADALVACRQMIIELHRSSYAGDTLDPDELSARLQREGFHLIARDGAVFVFER